MSRAAKARLKYLGCHVLAFIRLAFIFGIPVFALYYYGKGIMNFKGRSFSLSVPDYIIGFLCIVLWVTAKVLEEPLERYQAHLRNERDFDENGLNKKYNEYQKLTPAERAAIDKQKLADVESLIGTGALKKMTKDGSEDPEKDLTKLLGLQDIKHHVMEMAARMEFDSKNAKTVKAAKKESTSQVSANHMCFMGPPGTGKTSIAKVMTGFLYKFGYIKYNKYIETDGNFLRGTTAGETSKKTSLLISMAKGKVLFIDEAYALFSGNDAQEAIASIIKAMEDDRDKFILIIAGYEHEMKQLIDANPGFFSRIGHILYFGNYTDDELCDIFSYMANQHNFYVPYETRERLIKRLNNEKKEKYFGNARTCRNILDQSISKHALNIKMGVDRIENNFVICPEDIDINPVKY